MAQTDPFPDVDDGAYQNNMTIVGQVRKGYEILPEGTIVAVYCGDEIRGKGATFSQGPYTSFFMINICGETNDQLTFKVYTEGEIKEVDQGLKFTADAWLGSVSDFYYIDLVKKGDVNGDGNVTAQDASLVLQLVAKKISSTSTGIVYGAADVNSDNDVTAQDASLILQYVAKKITW
jgi:hypothetical protein